MSDETLLTSRKYAVVRRHVTLPDGTAHTYDEVQHPGAAVILPILPDGRVLLQNVYRFTVGRDLLELPAGTLDPGEDPQTAAGRELTEETGYRAGKLTLLLEMLSTPGFCNERMFMYVAEELTAGPTALEAGEVITPAPMALDDALSAVGDGRIVDGKSVAALLYYDRFAR